uniref:YSIRK-type signal peptide-containing protein n=1 Tax=Gemella cuniculi TaxID=150240 RepID=UPI000480AECD
MFNRNRKNYNTEKIMRYGIRKSNFGIASVVVAAGLMFLGASTAQAAETTEESTSISEPKNSQENVDSSTTIKKNDEANSPEYVQTGTEITANKKVIFDNNAGGETQAKAEKYTLTEGVSTNVSMEDRHGARIYKTAPVLNDDIAENPDKNKFTFGIFDFDGNDKSTEYVTLSRSYDSTDANIYIELREKNTNKLKESLTLGSVGETKSFSDPSFTRNGKTPVFSYTASTTGGRDMFNINFGKAGAEFTYRYKLNTGNSNMVGTQVTDANFLVPQFHDQTTYYMVINPSNASYDSTKADTDTASQTYVPDHTEKTLATFVQTALDGQNYQASGIREFEGYKLYQLASPAGVNGTIFPSYPVGFQFRNAFGGQWKRIIEVVGPNNTTVVKAYVRNPDSTAPNTQANNNETNLVTDGYILAHATEPLAAGAWNTEVVPSKEIFTDKEGRTLIGLSTNNGGAGTANGALTISFKDGNAVPNYTTGNLLLTNPLSNGFEAIYYYVQQGRVLVNYIDSKTGQNIFGTGLTNLDSTETITIEDPKKTKSGASIIDQDWKVPGTDDTYDTTDHKPTYIKTADGKTYKLVTKAGSTDNSISYNENGVVTGDGHATPTGKLLTGTQTVTYAYEEIGGEVTVSYEVAGNPSVKLFTDKASTKVAEKREVKPAETPVGENYDSTTDEFYPETLYGEDGTAYTRVAANKDGVLDGVGVKDGSAPVKGEVISGNQHITYLYVAQPGKVVVNYVDVNNNPISGTGSNEEIITTKGIVDTESGTARTNYNTGEHKPKIITAEDGTTYKITTEAINNDNITSENGVRTKDGDAPETGKVIGGKTQIVTYVYEKVSGNVYVKYETEDGTPITGTVTFDEDQSVEIPTDKGIVDTNDSPINKEYNTNDHKPKTIKTADGKTYELVAYNSDKVINGVKQGEGNAPESGQVTEGDQTVTYVYREVKGGSVVVRYENTNGEEIKDPQTSQPKDTPVGTPYDTT